MLGNAHLTLLCGYCPTRRELGHVTVYDGRGAPLVMVAVGQRKWRPKQAVPVPWQPVPADVQLGIRCTKRHPWSPTGEELLAAYREAVAAGRREIVLGVDLCRPLEAVAKRVPPGGLGRTLGR
jgi:hypothetical protein